VLCRLFGWSCAAEFKAILRRFGGFDMLTKERVQGNRCRWQTFATPGYHLMSLYGVTSDSIRCIDPTAAGIVIKIIRTWIE
jgi:hypothetical protein